MKTKTTYETMTRATFSAQTCTGREIPNYVTYERVLQAREEERRIRLGLVPVEQGPRWAVIRPGHEN